MVNLSKLLQLNWQQYQVIIFDVDGTLYDLSKMHRLMRREFLRYYVRRPWRCYELVVIYYFRINRERLAREGAREIAHKQYAIVAKKFGLSVEQVKKIIEYWMEIRPLEYLADCAYPEVKALIENIFQTETRIVYYSDYYPLNKISRLGLPYHYWFDSSAATIDALKPAAGGLEYIMKTLAVTASDCLLIGDRYDKEGLAAQKVGMDYLILD